MSAPPRIAINTKACTEALGAERALAAIAEADVASGVVLWAGESGQHIDAGVAQARILRLPILALALPRARGLGDGRRALSTMIARAAELDVPAVALMFGDAAGVDAGEADWRTLGAWLRDLPVSPCVENSGRAADRFADLGQLAPLLAEVPALRVVLDVGHLASSGRAGHDAAALAERIAWIDVHDNDGLEDRHWPLGQGTGDGSFRFGIAAFCTFPPWVVIETDPGIGEDSRAWVRAIRNDGACLTAVLAAHTEKGRLDDRPLDLPDRGLGERGSDRPGAAVRRPG